jgi:phage terminase large subunit GpA-like protein
MKATGANFIENAARDAWRPIDRRPPWQWAEDNITIDKTSPFPGKFRADTAAWTKDLMEVFADNRVSEITVMCSAQSSKTQTIMMLLAWAIAEDAGPAMWVMAANDEAKTFCRTRLMPTLEQCPAIVPLLPTDRGGIRSTEIDFASMPLIVNGANSKSKLQSKPIRWLFLDEVRNYPAGALEMVLKRTRAFWNTTLFRSGLNAQNAVIASTISRKTGGNWRLAAFGSLATLTPPPIKSATLGTLYCLRG